MQFTILGILNKNIKKKINFIIYIEYIRWNYLLVIFDLKEEKTPKFV